MRSGLYNGVRCDNCGLVPGGKQTFESLYDANAGWHDEREGGSENRDIKRLGEGERGR